MSIQPPTPKTNLVYGQVTDKINQPLANLIVQAYDRDMRSEELLGETVTDKNGKYEISWSANQLTGRERKEADIAIKLLTKEKKTLLLKRKFVFH